jgi:hypothetical protein
MNSVTSHVYVLFLVRLKYQLWWDSSYWIIERMNAERLTPCL